MGSGSGGVPASGDSEISRSALFPPPPPGEASSHTGDGLSLTMLTAEEVRGRFDACCTELGRLRGWSAGQRKAELDRTKESSPKSETGPKRVERFKFQTGSKRLKSPKSQTGAKRLKSPKSQTGPKRLKRPKSQTGSERVERPKSQTEL